MAIKTFTTGEVLTASDTNTYLANAGLDYITAGTASAQNRLNIASCFSATYAAYRVVVTNLTHTTANNLIMRFSASGTDTAGASYYTQRAEVTGGTVSGLASAIAVSDGGTGATTFTNGAILIGSGTSALTTLAPTPCNPPETL